MSVATVRNYRESDYPMVASWWQAAREVAPLPGMMPEESSFVLEIEGRPVLAVTVYLTNTPELAYVENFIGNPDERGPARKLGSHVLSDHIAGFARSRGYKRLMCMTEKPALMGHYSELGFNPTLSGVTTLVRCL